MTFEERQAINDAVIEGRDFETDEDGDCSWCGGDGFQECDDPLGCTQRHYASGAEDCSACRGSGLAKDQTIW